MAGAEFGISLLHEISQIMDHAENRSEFIQPVLEVIGPLLEKARLTVGLINRDTGQIDIEECFVDLHHASPHELVQIKQARYTVGEGIIGKVAESGVPRVVTDFSTNTGYLDRTKTLKKYAKPAFVCVPVKLEDKVVGTFSALWECEDPAQADAVATVFAIVASLIAGAVRFRQMEEEKARLLNQLQEKRRPNNIIGNSKPMRYLYQQIGLVSGAETTVMLRGESGVGKELVAAAIHYASHRAKRPFVKVNCGAMPANLLESELFGHERGAFTGAIRQRRGCFEQANGGTLFLDEIGDFSPSLQVSLLRVLQEREFVRVGGEEPLKVDVRIIAATNRDLEAQMATEAFRPDLYYRLAVFPIHIPPLRERKEDILTLADYFVESHNARSPKKIRRITTPAMNALMTYPWPGNVRELQNCIERAILLASGPVINESDLPATLQTASTSNTRTEGKLQMILDSREKELISEAIIETRGNMASAARLLGITERQMGCRMHKYQIDPKRYR